MLRASNLPRLAILDEFPEEFESEGLGMLIYRLPRIDVLQDADFSAEGSHGLAAARDVAPGEFERLQGAHVAWVAYLAMVSGYLNAVTLQGIFQQPVTHFAGASTTLAYKLISPPAAAATGEESSTFSSLLCLILAFSLGSFVCGFILTAPSSIDSKKYVVRRIDYPNVQEWRWKHQALVSMCIASLGTSYAIARNIAGDDKTFASSVSYGRASSSAFLFACACSAFAAGVLNALSSSGRRITIRCAHVTGSVNDVFLGLGFALRSRSLRFLWRVQMLMWNYSAFLAGAVCGSLVFSSNCGFAAVGFCAIMLAPLWALGVGMLFARRMQKRS
jgi:uncharacterized membrane protein YoaK (UPF0700 family)